MSYDLSSKHNYMSMDGETFGKLFHLAQLFGWEPRGTERPEVRDTQDEDGNVVEGVKDWSGGYLSNDWQIVTGRDGAEWCTALGRAEMLIEVLRALGPEKVKELLSDDNSFGLIREHCYVELQATIKQFRGLIERGFRIS